MPHSPGLLLILSAPSGAGKTTLAHMLRNEYGSENAVFSISYTTRAPRGREKDGVDYHFVAHDDFRSMVDRGEFVEWAEVHGHWYGTHRSYIDLARHGKLVIFDIDVQGGTTIKGKHPEAASVFILPPSMQELERRLRERKTDSEEVIQETNLVLWREFDRFQEGTNFAAWACRVALNQVLAWRKKRQRDRLLRQPAPVLDADVHLTASEIVPEPLRARAAADPDYFHGRTIDADAVLAEMDLA
ncbi:MAG: guanylate kinase, partial [Myxococcales bacterium]